MIETKKDFSFPLGFTPRKPEQPLKGIKSQRKEKKKTYRTAVQNEPKDRRCRLSSLDLQTFGLLVKGKYSAVIPNFSCARKEFVDTIP